MSPERSGFESVFCLGFLFEGLGFCELGSGVFVDLHSAGFMQKASSGKRLSKTLNLSS